MFEFLASPNTRIHRLHVPALILILITSAACGSVSEQSDYGIDGPRGDPADPRVCKGPFSSPTQVLGLPASDMTFSQDELTAYFQMPGGGNTDIFQSARLDVNTSFGVYVFIASTGYNDYQPALASDGLSLYFHADLPSPTLSDIYFSTRPSLSAQFGPAGPLVGLATTSMEYAPDISSYSLYFTSEASDGFAAETWRTPRIGAGFGSREKVAEINSTGIENNVTVREDDLAIFWASNRPGGLGGMDIWMSVRSSIKEEWGPPENLSAVNTANNDYPQYISPDGCRLYVMRPGAGVFVSRSFL